MTTHLLILLTLCLHGLLLATNLNIVRRVDRRTRHMDADAVRARLHDGGVRNVIALPDRGAR